MTEARDSPWSELYGDETLDADVVELLDGYVNSLIKDVLFQARAARGSSVKLDLREEISDDIRASRLAGRQSEATGEYVTEYNHSHIRAAIAQLSRDNPSVRGDIEKRLRELNQTPIGGGEED